MQYQIVVSIGNIGLGNVFYQLLFGLEYILSIGRQPYSFRHPENMRIHRHFGTIEKHSLNEKGRMKNFR